MADKFRKPARKSLLTETGTLLPPYVHDDLVNAIWRTLDPAGYNAMVMESVFHANPNLRKSSDSRAGQFILEDRIMSKSPGVVDALIERNETFKQDVEQGPLTGNDLDKIIMDMMRTNALEAYNIKKNL